MPARQAARPADPVGELGHELASWTPNELARFLAGITDPATIEVVEAALGQATGTNPDRYFPEARPKQTPPEGDWLVWLIMAGRGFGKTRTGAEFTVNEALTHQAAFAVVAPTFGDGRDICFEGRGDLGQPSGIISVLERRGLFAGQGFTWNRSMGELRLKNGALLKLISAEDPDRARGWNFAGGWADELGSWPYPDAFDQLRFALRVGTMPRLIVTTTPRPTFLIRSLVEQSRIENPSVVVMRGSTSENRANLSPHALAELERRYGGTRLGRQELEGELLDDIEGALWKKENIIHTDKPPRLARICIGIDPSTWGPDTGGEHATVGRGIETGIVVAGIDTGQIPKCYVLEDLSGRYSPDEWATIAVDAWRRWRTTADTTIVPETNAGGGMVTATIRLVDPSARIYSENGKSGVRASVGKRARAEPVAGLYEQHRAYHLNPGFAVLETQMCFPAGTLVATELGAEPVETVPVGRHVWTRDGLQPVTSAGVTGVADSLIEISHPLGCLLCTETHPIWTVEDGFVPAKNVNPSRHHLIVGAEPDMAAMAEVSTSTDLPSVGVAAGGRSTRTAITGTRPREDFSTVWRGSPIAAQSRTAITSTIATKTPRTTGSRTSSWSAPRNTPNGTLAAAGHRWGMSNALERLVHSGILASHESSPALFAASDSQPLECGPSTAPTDVRLSPTAGQSPPGPSNANASGAAIGSSLLQPERATVPIVAVRRVRVPRQPVYDLTVADAHEFFADGVLVHNCEWDSTMPWSPDRVDALVWAITALKPWAYGGASAAPAIGRKVQAPNPGARAAVGRGMGRIGRPGSRGR